ncbi:uncharacterized protein LOC127701757 [Mytilus californianus]|uniref:uncharacterized protein LOC127701757 n=1 Tax=Mytilus californianus TaxID=6549 RepID=UPI002245446D|nr:uncharacterized protein LOC127701757 [Mytilus californianus]
MMKRASGGRNKQIMGERPPLFVILPILLVLKIMFWVAVCYRCSNRSRISRTTIIQQTVTRGPVDNGITGIENPGYMQQPPANTEATIPNSSQAPVPPSYDQITKGPCFAEQYDQDTPRY